MGKIKTIGILTSGGDAPGMNAAIRAVTRAGIYNGFNIKGIYRGYEGLINGEVKPFTTENVSGIITRGGTILKTARSKEFMTPEGMQKAYETCQKEEIDALIVIGGNGSLTGAWPVKRIPILETACLTVLFSQVLELSSGGHTPQLAPRMTSCLRVLGK